MVNTYFRWNFGGQNVQLTGTKIIIIYVKFLYFFIFFNKGSFTNWKNHVPMKKIGHEFNLILVNFNYFLFKSNLFIY